MFQGELETRSRTEPHFGLETKICQSTRQRLTSNEHSLNMQLLLWACRFFDVSIMHLSIYMSERLSHSVAKYKQEWFDTFKSLYYEQLLQIYFPELDFSGKIIVLWYFIALMIPWKLPFLWHFAPFALLLSYAPARRSGRTQPMPSLLQKTASPLTSLCPFPSLPLNTNHWPAAPAASPLLLHLLLLLLLHDPLTSSCFSCCRRQLSKCLCEELLSFSLSPDQFPKWTLWHVLKYSGWWAK